MKNRKRHLIGIAGALSGILLLTACAAADSQNPPAQDSSTQPASTAVQESGTQPASAAVQESAYHSITAEDAKARIEEGNVMVVDVRTAEEYEEAHVPGAIHVPNESIGGSMPDALPDQDAVLIVYCRTGVRSRQASDKLVGLGYTQVYDMGGIVDWPYETEGSGTE